MLLGKGTGTHGTSAGVFRLCRGLHDFILQLASVLPRQDADTLQGLLDLEGPELVLGGTGRRASSLPVVGRLISLPTVYAARR